MYETVGSSKTTPVVAGAAMAPASSAPSPPARRAANNSKKKAMTRSPNQPHGSSVATSASYSTTSPMEATTAVDFSARAHIADCCSPSILLTSCS
eukprot:scaffold108933_cov31-Tisochrysis_lutea.AAC.3